MEKTKRYIVLKITIVVALSITFFSCNKRLDDFLFNDDNTITSYQLDDYRGETSLSLPSNYFIPDSLIYKFFYPIESEGGETLQIAAIYTGDPKTISEDTIIFYCHGNRDHMDFYWPRQKIYGMLGGTGNYGVLMLDYPGYGLSEGKPTEENMYEAVEGALNWLLMNGVTNERLIMFGFSLGSAPTCKIAAGGYPLTPSKIILEAPFASAEVMIQDATKLAMPGSFFVSLKIDNAEQIRNVQSPLLWLHGVADDFLAIDTHGEVVYQNHTSTYKRAARVEGGGHETVPTFMGLENYEQTILDFIRSSE